MTSTTNELLLKTRKGATAAFGVKEWGTVLVELGMGFQTTKTGRTVTEVKVQAPDYSATLTIVKEPNYKRISFYKLSGWLKDNNLDLAQMASAKLGLDTPEIEKAKKELYERDLTNTGTCPVCEGNFKGATSLVHHGYKRPGDGQGIFGDCFGVGYRAFELSPKGTIDYLERVLRPHLAKSVTYLAQLQAGEVTKFYRARGFSKNAPLVEITAESDKYEFDSMLSSAIGRTSREIMHTEDEIHRLEVKIANWKLDVLPEIKHAGKFKVA